MYANSKRELVKDSYDGERVCGRIRLVGAVLIDRGSEGIDDGRYDKLGASLGLDVGVR